MLASERIVALREHNIFNDSDLDVRRFFMCLDRSPFPAARKTIFHSVDGSTSILFHAA